MTGLVVVVLAWVTLAAPRPAVAQSFPKIPYVENLTEGFRIEKTFSSISVAPSNPDIVYLGTNNGYIYTSNDGGRTWDEHDLVNRPFPREFPLKPRSGLDLKPRAYADMYNWPQETWELPELEPVEFMDPIGFRIQDLLPPESASVFPTYTSGQLAQLFVRQTSWFGLESLKVNYGNSLPSTKSSEQGNLNISWLEVHPEDPDTAFAVTNDGLFRSNDRGHTWVREFDNPMAERRITNHVAFHPPDPDTRFLCTKKGLYVTEDDGENYNKVEDSIIARIGCNYVAFHPERPNELWVGAVFGVWVSKDFGKSFDLKFYTRVPGQMQIRRVRFGPNNPQNILLGSDNIGFISRDGGKSFQRVGGFSFTGQRIANVMFTGQPGHLLVATDKDIWRSTDWGESWEAVVFGNTGWLIKWIFFPRGASGPLWVLSQGELLELQRKTPRKLSARQLRRVKKLFADEPTMSSTMTKAIESNRAYRPDLNRYRRKARSAHLLPELQAVATRRNVLAEFIGRGRFYGQAAGSGESLPKVLSSEGTFNDWHFEVYGNWDIASLIFDRRALPKGENFQYNETLARSLRETVQLVYAERRRIQIKNIVDPNPSVRVAVMRDLRVRELTHLLDIVTDGWFAAQVGESPGNRESGQ